MDDLFAFVIKMPTMHRPGPSNPNPNLHPHPNPNPNLHQVRASLVRLGARRRLEQLAAWGGANATLAAKAAQALKEHVAEASGSLCS